MVCVCVIQGWPAKEEAGSEPEIKRKTDKELRGDSKLLNLIRKAIEAASDESGWAHLGGVGSSILKQAPDFDPRNYGYPKLVLIREGRGR